MQKQIIKADEMEFENGALIFKTNHKTIAVITKFMSVIEEKSLNNSEALIATIKGSELILPLKRGGNSRIN